LVLCKERLFESRVDVVRVYVVPQKVRGVDVSVYVHECPTASDELLTEEQMDSLLCGDVPVRSHPCKKTLHCIFGGLIFWQPGTEVGQRRAVGIRHGFWLARIFADVPDSGRTIKNRL
jgi:hypothetical protein